jgi:hypothetical protein
LSPTANGSISNPLSGVTRKQVTIPEEEVAIV